MPKYVWTINLKEINMDQEQEIDLTKEIDDLIKHYEKVKEENKEGMDKLRFWLDSHYETYLEHKKKHDEARDKLTGLKYKLENLDDDSEGDDDE